MLGIFEKLINEHGSSTIQKERIQLIKEQYEDLERKLKTSEEKNILLKKENENLIIENKKLKRDFYFDGHVYWDRVSRFPYCPRCYGEDKRIQMVVMDTDTNGALDGYCCLTCGIKHIDLP